MGNNLVLVLINIFEIIMTFFSIKEINAREGVKIQNEENYCVCYSLPPPKKNRICSKEEQIYFNCVMHLSMKSPEGGGGSVNPREFDRDAYPQGGDFDLTSCI